MSKAGMLRSVQIYNFLLKFYPREFRQEFGGEMKYVFSKSLIEARREHGAQGTLTFWGRTILDTVRSAVTQHLENRRASHSMETKNKDLLMQNRVFVWIALATGVILLLPLVAMQFTTEVTWTLLDFFAAGGLVFGAGLAFVLAARRTQNWQHRIVIGAVVAAVSLYLWAELAVGVFTDWGS